MFKMCKCVDKKKKKLFEISYAQESLTKHGTMETWDDCFKYLEENKSISIGDPLAFDAGNFNNFYLVYALCKLWFISF